MTIVNLLTPDVRANPYPLYAELRRNSPVCEVAPGGIWAVTRFEDVMTILKNPQLYPSEGFRRAYQPPWFPDYPMGDSMLTMDPPYHTRMRALVNRAFGTAALARLEPRVRQRVEQIVNELPMGQPVNFVQAFSERVPASVMGDLFGIPSELHPRVTRWVEVLALFTGTAPNDTERQERIRNAAAEVRRSFETVVAERRSQPGDDMVSDLLRARVEGEALSDKELMGFLFLLLVAGVETTAHLLSHSAVMLRDKPELMARLRAEPALIPRFVEEMLRYEPPVHGVFRLTASEVVLGGVRLPKGTRLLLVLCSANRDEAQFQEPDRFDLDRDAQTVPFGHGIHFCLGAPLARLEARLALEALVSRSSRLTQAEGPVQWNSSFVVRGPVTLPLVVHPA
jgi:cytochrome P450